MKKVFVIFLSVVLSSFSVLFSQDEHNSPEIDSSVPELSAFHKVVYPMWHKAYPDKDYELLKKLLPDVNSGAEKIYSAKLSGILRDKQDEWNEGLKKLRSSVENFNKACNENIEPDMLASAEILHSNYEMLVRIVRPVTKEVDEFHKVLYMIYHHYAPEHNSAELNKAIDTLVVRAGELKKSVLPKRAANKQESFLRLCDELYNSTMELQKVKDSDPEELNKTIDKVHSDYQKLEAIFD